MSSFLESLPLPLHGMELRVTSALPFDGTNADGEPLGPVHWFPMYDYILVSRELWDHIKTTVPSSEKAKEQGSGR